MSCRVALGLSSTIIYTSELILCSTICVPSATRHDIHIFGNRSSSHSLRALAAVFGLSSFGLEEYLKKKRNNMNCYLSLTHLWNLLCNFEISQN